MCCWYHIQQICFQLTSSNPPPYPSGHSQCPLWLSWQTGSLYFSSEYRTPTSQTLHTGDRRLVILISHRLLPSLCRADRYISLGLKYIMSNDLLTKIHRISFWITNRKSIQYHLSAKLKSLSMTTNCINVCKRVFVPPCRHNNIPLGRLMPCLTFTCHIKHSFVVLTQILDGSKDFCIYNFRDLKTFSYSTIILGLFARLTKSQSTSRNNKKHQF